MTRSRVITLAAVGLAAAAILAVVLIRRQTAGLPAEGSAAYEETTRLFYRGLAALQVGLSDDAKREFAAAAEAAPGEPAPLANLALAHLRLGEFVAAVPPLDRASALAPSSGEIAFLLGRLETSRGQRDEGIRHLRRAVELAPADPYARMALVQEIEYAAGPDADAEAQRLLEEMVQARPGNPALLVERARLAAKRGDAALLADSVKRLEPLAAAWPPEVVEQFRAVQQAASGGAAADTARAVAFLRNVLARVPAFLESRASVTPAAELIANPLVRFLKLPNVPATPSPADAGLTFAREAIGAAGTWTTVIAASLDGEQPPAVFAVDERQIQRLDRPGPPLAFPGAAGTVPARHAVQALDWNHDFRLDLIAAGAAGVRLYLQTADGNFTDPPAGTAAIAEAARAWAADVEMDGDLDAVIARRGRTPVVLRNNGDGTWRETEPFPAVTGAVAFVWGDFDTDGDPDAAFVDDAGALHVFVNRQAGVFERIAGPTSGATGLVALALGDVNADGVLDVVSFDSGGRIRRSSLTTSGWREEVWAEWSGGTPPSAADTTALFLADLDNNGAVDLIGSTPGGSAVWLAGADYALTALDLGPSRAIRVLGVADLNSDGQLDLVGLESGAAVRLMGRGTRGYHWQVIRPRAQTAAGDQRINSFGVGGDVEVRAGLLVHRQPITGPVVHAGLGDRTRIDVTRIVWPNGVPQAEFDPAVDQPIVAHQRLKGSCPWIFADDGTGLQFVTDFLWRSPLGLRSNAQDTAGISQTEDWVKIRGDQLRPRDGVYDIRISAELWETHYIDHVSLLVVDHPEDVEVFVDERFAREAPAPAVHPLRHVRPVAAARDHHGRDVTDLVTQRDGRYLGAFARGQYQGVAEEHFVEFEIDEAAARDRTASIVAHGWVYPTDSSINVAIGQGGRVQPRGLSLEAQDAAGRWVVVAPDLGFPAGKNKTILIGLDRLARAGLAGARRLRLRTNLEIYWDAIAVGQAAPAAGLRTTRLDAATADLRYRGFSVTERERREMPEVPIHARLANTMPMWRDLVGYYTRFGDVVELVRRVEDRYVIMNAGDELRLAFPAPPPPGAGWVRDFVLIGDGWNKDGDFNTGFSKTVLPLPQHGRPDYRAASFEPALEDDPVYRRHAGDWQQYHTRFVAPRPFLEGLRHGLTR